MIILDTNVISELMRANPKASVLEWINRQSSYDLSITAITVAEILYGLAKMREGKRKTAVFDAAEKMFEEDFSGRILPFGENAAVEYAAVVVEREKSGRPISMADAQIASICLHHEYSLATRNIRDFEDTGVAVINPWIAS